MNETASGNSFLIVLGASLVAIVMVIMLGSALFYLVMALTAERLF